MSATSTAGRLVRRYLPFERDFVMLPNSWVRDKRLSWRARAILAYLMSQQVGWSVTIKSLAAEADGNAERSTDGLASVRKAVGELERYGYLQREQQRDRRGRLTHTEWVICDPHDPVDNSTEPEPIAEVESESYPQGDGPETGEIPDQHRNAIYRRRFEPTSVNTDVGESHDIRKQSLKENSSTYVPDVTTRANSANAQGGTASSMCSRSPFGFHDFDTTSGWCIHACGTRTETVTTEVHA